MVHIAIAVVLPEEGDVPITLTSALLLLVLLIPRGWASNIWLHANTDFWLLSTKDKLMHLLSTTWVSLPVRRLGERDQTHKGRETFFALLLAGIHVVGTSTALVITDIQDVRYRFADIPELAVHYMPFYLPPISLHLGGCALLLLFEKTVHPWRHLGKERERNCRGKLEGSRRGIEAEPTIGDQVSVRCKTSLVFTFTFSGRDRARGK